MLFLGYCCAMAMGLLLNLRHQSAFALRLFYAAVIVSAHYKLALHSHELGQMFYYWCGFAQFLVMCAAIGIRCEAAMPMALLAAFAVVVNVLAFNNFPAHTGIWTWYYQLINTVEVLQMACLVIVSPVTLPWIRKILTNKRSERTWMLRLLEI